MQKAPKHALQRTRPAVTLAASCLRLSPTAQQSRQPRESLSLRTLILVAFLSIVPYGNCHGDEPDKYGANGPCAYLFKQPGGTCLDGAFTLEIEVGQKRKIVLSKVIGFTTSKESSGSVEPLAKCVAEHMDFYSRWHVKEPDKPGKQVITIHVVNANTCG